MGDVSATKNFDAKFVPRDTDNYKTIETQITVKVYITTISSTFVANAPSGITTTVDGDQQVTKTLGCEGETEQHTLTETSFPEEVKITSENSQDYVFAGWSTSKTDTAKYGIAQYQMVGSVVSADVTYYAIWFKTSGGYWMGTKDAGEEYVDEGYFIAHDKNYVPASEIKADMEILHGSASAERTAVQTKWDGYYNEDRRLYTTYAGGENEPSYYSTCTKYETGTGETSIKNKYVEFRILEVSSTIECMAAIAFPHRRQHFTSIQNVFPACGMAAVVFSLRRTCLAS